MLSLQKISTKHILITVALLNFLMLFHGGVLRDNPMKHYKEDVVGTHISIALLFVTGIITLRIFLNRTNQIIWLLIGLGFIFLAFDDGFMIHERLDFRIHRYFGIQQTSLTDRLDDFLIVLYGLIGLFFLYRYREEILRYKFLPKYLVIGFAILLVTAFLDILTNDSAIFRWIGFPEAAISDTKKWLGAIEEVGKLMGGAVFLCGFLQVLRQVRQAPDKTADVALDAKSGI